MSEQAAAAETPAAPLHLPTVVAIAVVAYALTNVAHEGLGHGGMCVAVGGKPEVLNAIYFACEGEGLGGGASKWVSAGGTITNLILAALTFGLIRTGVVRSGAGRYFLWLFSTLNLLQAFGYWMFSGVAGIGDWEMVVSGWPYYPLWRIALAGLGFYTYMYLAVPLALRGLEPFLGAELAERLRRARALTFPGYLAGGLLYVTAGLFNPESPMLILISAAAASFGGTSALAWMTKMLRDTAEFPPASGPTLGISASRLWVAVALVIAGLFVALLGPGIRLAS